MFSEPEGFCSQLSAREERRSRGGALDLRKNDGDGGKEFSVE